MKICGLNRTGFFFTDFSIKCISNEYKNIITLKSPLKMYISVQYGPDKDFLIKYEGRYKPKVTVQSSSQSKNILLLIILIIGILIFTNK